MTQDPRVQWAARGRGSRTWKPGRLLCPPVTRHRRPPRRHTSCQGPPGLSPPSSLSPRRWGRSPTAQPAATQCRVCNTLPSFRLPAQAARPPTLGTPSSGSYLCPPSACHSVSLPVGHAPAHCLPCFHWTTSSRRAQRPQGLAGTCPLEGVALANEWRFSQPFPVSLQNLSSVSSFPLALPSSCNKNGPNTPPPNLGGPLKRDGGSLPPVPRSGAARVCPGPALLGRPWGLLVQGETQKPEICL